MLSYCCSCSRTAFALKEELDADLFGRHSSTAATAVEEVMAMAKPILTSNKEEEDMSSKAADTTKLPATHMPNRQTTPTSKNPLPRNLRTEGDSNKGAMTADMVNQLVLAVMVRLSALCFLGGE